MSRADGTRPVPDDASLDRFAGAAETGEPPASGERGAEADATDADGDADDATPDAPAVTYRFLPGGGPCADCGATAERRWTSDAGPVCPDCKGWTV